MKQAANRVLLPIKCWLTFNGLHVILSQKKEFFLITAVRTSNPNYFFSVILLKKMGKSLINAVLFRKKMFVFFFLLLTMNVFAAAVVYN